MRYYLRFIIPLGIALVIFVYALFPMVDGLIYRWFTSDVNMRSNLISSTIADPVRRRLSAGATAELKDYLENIANDGRLYAIGICMNQQLRVKTDAFPSDIKCPLVSNANEQRVVQLGDVSYYISSRSWTAKGDEEAFQTVIIHDLTYVFNRTSTTRAYIFWLFVGLGCMIALITIAVAQVSWRGWSATFRSVLSGEMKPVGKHNTPPELVPLLKDLRSVIMDLENEKTQYTPEQLEWSAKSLKGVLKRNLYGDEIIVVSNREPYIHNHKEGGSIEVQTPASGLVTALEPVLRACGGTWVAHGSGDADREVSDAKGRIMVPEDAPAYKIRRVWLTEEQEAGYYFGFSNEGMWPLCHNTFNRPIFRESDWQQYVKVNQLFAKAVLEEVKSQNPVILVQDYHFALLPMLIRKKLPEAIIISFWHIPWPNPEIFGICPYKEEILNGMLGSSIVGFQTKFYANNFLDTLDRFMETRIDREVSGVAYNNHLCLVRSYPISIEWPPKEFPEVPAVQRACKRKVAKLYGISEDAKLAVGVERLDYAKGIVERFLAVERLLELHPALIGKFFLVQIAAPSRSSLPSYANFKNDVEETASRVNRKYEDRDYKPIILKLSHHNPKEITMHFRAADICIVSSLHDGMNLVAKEFIAARKDESGMLVLSQFTGAARELPEAIIVNPFDTESFARALYEALLMPRAEQKKRMANMRRLVKEFNVFRWAGRMLIDAGKIRRRELIMGQQSKSMLEALKGL